MTPATQPKPFKEKPADPDYICAKCNKLYRAPSSSSPNATLAFSLTALICYFPANILPFMSMELYGKHNSSTIWSGIKTLTEEGSWPIALIIFLASIAIPLLKLLILFFLSFTVNQKSHFRLKLRLYQILESIGRWSMLDIFILGIMVSIMKIRPWTSVNPEPGSFFFACVVIFTMLASACFNPDLISKGENENFV